MPKRRPRPKDVLSHEDYSNYRNVRAVAVLFILFGSIYSLLGLAVGGEALGNAGPLASDPEDRTFTIVFFLFIGTIGVCGVVGGIATLCGNRGLAPLVKVMACLYLLGFPIGTLLGYVMLKGHSRYLESLDEIQGVPDASVFD